MEASQRERLDRTCFDALGHDGNSEATPRMPPHPRSMITGFEITIIPSGAAAPSTRDPEQLGNHFGFDQGMHGQLA